MGGIASSNGGGDCFIVGGHFALADRHAGILLGALSPVVHVREEPTRWRFAGFWNGWATSCAGGKRALPWSRTILVQALRLHMAESARAGVGWLFALADKQISAAITAVHNDPAHRWTLQMLAEHAGTIAAGGRCLPPPAATRPQAGGAGAVRDPACLRRRPAPAMDLRQLEAFVMVAKLSSFAAAADRLCITQPAISIRIAGFEQELGRKLFDQAGRTVALTPAGHEMLPHATRMVTDAQVFRRSTGALKFLANRIRIGTTDSFLRISLEPIISRFQALHPTISLDLSVGDTSFVWQELLSGKVDVGFHANAQPHSSLRSVPLYVTDLVWVAKPGLVPEGGLTLSQIAPFHIFTTRQGSMAYSAVARLFGNARIDGARLCGINSVDGIIRFAEAGLGVAVLTGMAAEERIKLGRVVELTPGLALPSVPYVVSHRTKSLSDAGRVLTDIAFAA